MTHWIYTPLRGSGHDGEKTDLRAILGMRYEVATWDRKTGRDVVVTRCRSEQEAKQAANEVDGIVHDRAQGFDRIVHWSKGYKRKTGMGRGGMGGRPDMQPQISDRADMDHEPEELEDWMADW